jgi:hypothetical protein
MNKRPIKKKSEMEKIKEEEEEQYNRREEINKKHSYDGKKDRYYEGEDYYETPLQLKDVLVEEAYNINHNIDFNNRSLDHKRCSSENFRLSLKDPNYITTLVGGSNGLLCILSDLVKDDKDYHDFLKQFYPYPRDIEYDIYLNTKEDMNTFINKYGKILDVFERTKTIERASEGKNEQIIYKNDIYKIDQSARYHFACEEMSCDLSLNVIFLKNVYKNLESVSITDTRTLRNIYNDNKSAISLLLYRYKTLSRTGEKLINDAVRLYVAYCIAYYRNDPELIKMFDTAFNYYVDQYISDDTLSQVYHIIRYIKYIFDQLQTIKFLQISSTIPMFKNIKFDRDYHDVKQFMKKHNTIPLTYDQEDIKKLGKQKKDYEKQLKIKPVKDYKYPTHIEDTIKYYYDTMAKQRQIEKDRYIERKRQIERDVYIKRNRSRSPERARNRSPERVRKRSPERARNRSRERVRKRSPERARNRSRDTRR